MEKKFKYIIITIITLVIAIGMILIIYLFLPKEESVQDILKKTEKEKTQWFENPIYIHKGQKPEKVRNASVFFTVDACVKQYLNYIAEQNTNAINGVLDEEYTQRDKIESYSKEQKYETKLVYVLSGEKYVTYYVKAEIENNENYFIVNTDLSNRSFSIIPISYTEFTNKVNEETKEDVKTEKIIQSNGYNAIKNVTVREEDMCDRYLKYYCDLLLNNPEKAYNLLDTEYKNKKFPNINEFKKYIQDNGNKFKQAHVKEYSVESREEKTTYTIQDIYNNYYVISEDSIMNFTIKLNN